MQTVGQITGLLSATCALFSLYDDHKAKKCQRDVSKLKKDSKRQAFINDICSRLDALKHSSEDVDERGTVFRDTSLAMDSLGPLANTGLMRMSKKSRISLKRNTKNTRHTSMISAEHLVRLPIQTDSPDWAQRNAALLVEQKWSVIRSLMSSQPSLKQ